MKFWKILIDSQYKVKIFALFIFVIGAFTILFGFQNCGKVRFSTDGTENINGNCSFNGAQIVLNPDTNLNSSTSINFSITPALDPGTTVQWTFQVQGGQPSNPTNTTTVDKTFGDGTYVVNALLTKAGPCTTNLTAAFTVSDTATCTQPTGIGGPTHGFVGDLQTFEINNVNAACFTGAAQWEMDQEINGVVNTNPHAINNPNPSATASYTYTSPGTYQVQVQVPNENYTATHDIIICSANQIFQNGQCVTVCVNPITQQQVAVGSTAQGYSSTAPTCPNTCHQITATCQATGQFSPAIYATCTNPTNCGGGTTCPAGQFLETNINNPSDKFCATYGPADGQWCHEGMWSQFWCRSASTLPNPQHMCTGAAYAPGWWVPQPDGCYHRNLGSCNDADGAHCEIYNHVDILRASTGQYVYTRQLTLAELQGEGGNNNYTYCANESTTPFSIPNTCACPAGSSVATSGPLSGACVCASNNLQPVNNQCPNPPPPTFSCTKNTYQCGDTVVCSASSFDNALMGCDPSGCYPLQGRANWTYNGNGQYSYAFANTPQNQQNTSDAIQHWSAKDVFGQTSPVSVVNIKSCGNTSQCPSGQSLVNGVCQPPVGNYDWNCEDGKFNQVCHKANYMDGILVDDGMLNNSKPGSAFTAGLPNPTNGINNSYCYCHTGTKTITHTDCGCEYNPQFGGNICFATEYYVCLGCGTANGKSYTSASFATVQQPSEELKGSLCGDGSAPTVSTAGNVWNWSCSGRSCSASRQ